MTKDNKTAKLEKYTFLNSPTLFYNWNFDFLIANNLFRKIPESDLKNSISRKSEMTKVSKKSQFWLKSAHTNFHWRTRNL